MLKCTYLFLIFVYSNPLNLVLMNIKYRMAVFVVFIIIALSCSKQYYVVSKENYQFHSSNGRPDFSDLNYWAAHPYKTDPSDSTPACLNKKRDSSVDVFFLYPTSLIDKKDTSWNAKIDDAEINFKTDYSSILYQASVFNGSARVFSPRYRQAHYRSFFKNKNEVSPYFDTAYVDIKNAFEYYLKNWNNGRPIIIASHSQGTVHAARLLKEYFENKPLSQKLVCAYLIGMPIKTDYFNNIATCKDPNSTGCFVSWRTFKKGYTDEFIKKEDFKTVVVNPVTWTMDTNYVKSKLNEGSILKNFNKKSKGVSSQIHENVLWTSKPKFFGNIFLTKKNYHIADINLFYFNIRENVQNRIIYYNKQH